MLTQLVAPASYQEIADSLSVSINAVRTHIRHIYARLGVNKRNDAVAHALALGLTAVSQPQPSMSTPIMEWRAADPTPTQGFAWLSHQLPRPVLQCLGQMLGLHPLLTGQIRDGTSAHSGPSGARPRA